MPEGCLKYDMLTEVALMDLCLAFILCDSVSTDPSTRTHFCYLQKSGTLAWWAL